MNRTFNDMIMIEMMINLREVTRVHNLCIGDDQNAVLKTVMMIMIIMMLMMIKMIFIILMSTVVIIMNNNDDGGYDHDNDGDDDDDDDDDDEMGNVYNSLQEILQIVRRTRYNN